MYATQSVRLKRVPRSRSPNVVGAISCFFAFLLPLSLYKLKILLVIELVVKKDMD